MVLPTDPNQRVATIDDIYVLFDTYLHRQPNYVTEGLPRVGHTYVSQMAQIRCSTEASNIRERLGLGLDTWCMTHDNTTGELVTNVPTLPPPPPPPPKPPPPPPGSDIPIVGDIIARLWPPIQAVLTKVNEIASTVGTNIGTTLRPVLEEVSATGARITQTLADNLTQLLPAALNLAAEAADKAAEVAAGFVENAATVGDVAGGFIDAIKLKQEPLATFIETVGSFVLEKGMTAALHTLEIEGGPTIDLLAKRVASIPDAPDELVAMMVQAQNQEAPFPVLPLIAALGFVAHSFVMAELSPEIEMTRQHGNIRNRAQIVGVNDAARLAVTGLRDYQPMQALGERQGFNADQFRMIADLSFIWPNPADIIAAWQRGYISEPQREAFLERLGYNAESRAVMLAMATHVAPVQDEILFMHRDVYEPNVADRFRLREDMPEQFIEQMRKLGVPREVAERYYMSSWQIPSPNQLFEMLHREQITLDDMRAGLRAADILPIFRDAFIKIAYAPLTRVDIRRVHDLLGKDHAWLVQQHKFIGYDAENAELLSRFTEALNADDKKERTKSLSTSLVSRTISAVVNGTMDDAQARELFGVLEFDADEIELFIEEAALVRGEARANRLWNLLGDLYIKGRRTRIEAATALRERGATEGEIEDRLREWDLEKELRAPTEREETQRDLTRTDIEGGYRARKLTKDDAKRMLIGLRYDDVEAEFILEMADYKEAQEIQKDRIEVVHRKFVKGTFDKTAAVQELDKIVDKATQRDALIARWETEIQAKSTDLSVAQIGELYKGRFWPDEKVKAYLLRIGFDEDESAALLLLWGSKVEEARQREAERERKEAETKAREAARILEAARRADKALAVSQLLAAGAAGVLGWDVVRAEIVAKGYSFGEADTLIRTKQATGVKRNA